MAREHVFRVRDSKESIKERTKTLNIILTEKGKLGEDKPTRECCHSMTSGHRGAKITWLD